MQQRKVGESMSARELLTKEQIATLRYTLAGDGEGGYQAEDVNKLCDMALLSIEPQDGASLIESIRKRVINSIRNGLFCGHSHDDILGDLYGVFDSIADEYKDAKGGEHD
jgi:hypothetical protein